MGAESPEDKSVMNIERSMTKAEAAWVVRSKLKEPRRKRNTARVAERRTSCRQAWLSLSCVLRIVGFVNGVTCIQGVEQASRRSREGLAALSMNYQLSTHLLPSIRMHIFSCDIKRLDSCHAHVLYSLAHMIKIVIDIPTS